MISFSTELNWFGVLLFPAHVVFIFRSLSLFLFLWLSCIVGIEMLLLIRWHDTSSHFSENLTLELAFHQQTAIFSAVSNEIGFLLLQCDNDWPLLWAMPWIPNKPRLSSFCASIQMTFNKDTGSLLSFWRISEEKAPKTTMTTKKNKKKKERMKSITDVFTGGSFSLTGYKDWKTRKLEEKQVFFKCLWSQRCSDSLVSSCKWTDRTVLWPTEDNRDCSARTHRFHQADRKGPFQYEIDRRCVLACGTEVDCVLYASRKPFWNGLLWSGWNTMCNGNTSVEPNENSIVLVEGQSQTIASIDWQRYASLTIRVVYELDFGIHRSNSRNRNEGPAEGKCLVIDIDSMLA